VSTRTLEGITVRHRQGCRTLGGGLCNCTPGYRAEAFDRRSGKRFYRTFPALAAAKSWRADAIRDIKTGTRRASSGMTLREAAEDWLDGTRIGSVRNRSGDIYTPSVIRSYAASLRARVLPALGGSRTSTGRRSTTPLIH
jgi:integrase